MGGGVVGALSPLSIMTKRDLFFAALSRETELVPSYTMAFFNIATARRLLGGDNVVTDYLPAPEYKMGASSEDNRRRNLRYAEKTDNFAIGVGQGASFAFGHGGPGEFMEKIIEQDGDGYISQYETGVKKVTKYHPHFYHNFDHPLADLTEEIQLPDPANPARYAGLRAEAEFYKRNGYLTYANLNGIFSGIHYFLYPYDALFMDMLLDPEGIERLVRKLSVFNLTAAEELLRQGIDCINFCDDLGDGRSLLFSRELYRQYFYPYHCELTALCHSYGAKAHMHSHGNICGVLDLLADAGIDMINPFDPSEIGPLTDLKEAYGDRFMIVGGLSKYFFDLPEEEMAVALSGAIQAGRKGGGFALMDSGGIPENISQERYDFYVDLSRRLRLGR